MAGGLESETASNDDRSVTDADTGVRATLEAYAELVRVPNLFTAPPDVLLGAALVAGAGFEPSRSAVAGLAVASILLYAGGTTLNDAFDAPVDARERPERPIPSGRVSRRTAFGLGFGLLLAAVTLAFVVGGPSSAVAAGLVAAAIVAYDGLLKGSAAGFLAMGTTRGLNVGLGTTAVGGGAGLAVLEVEPATLAVPVVVTVYIAAVTFMAAGETVGGNRGAVGVAVAGAVAALAVLGQYLLAVRPSTLEAAAAVAFAAAFCWWVGRPLRAAYADPVPETVGPAVGACILGLVLLDAAFAAASGVAWAVAAAAFLLPARGLSKVFDVT